MVQKSVVFVRAVSIYKGKQKLPAILREQFFVIGVFSKVLNMKKAVKNPLSLNHYLFLSLTFE